MKTMISVLLGLGILAGTVVYMNRPARTTCSTEGVGAETTSAPATEAAVAAAPKTTTPIKSNADQPKHNRPREDSVTRPDASRVEQEATLLKQSVDQLVSAQTSYGQKQAIWKQLTANGKLDQAIADLGQRMAAEPGVAEYPSALGQAYFKKCATLKDVREQAILAMQADKLFDVALELDPSNWDSRFDKAVALTYWPVGMNKGPEAIRHFQTLIQQQEGQNPQPQFADSYMWLGEQYQKSGRSDYAQAAWERGATLFPNHEGLKNKLATANTAQISNATGNQ